MRGFWMAAGACCLALAGARAAEFVAVEDGEARAAIVVAADADEAVRYAAERLQRYIRLRTGAELPVADDGADTRPPRFLVGESRWTRDAGLAASRLAEQEYLIQSLDGDLVLMGADAPFKALPGHKFANDRVFQPIGTVYAVNDFLMRFAGVRWYLPGALGEVVPRASDLRVPHVSLRRAPSVKHRNIHAFAWLHNNPFYYDIRFNDEFGPPRGPHLPLDVSLDWARALKIGGRPFSGGHGQMDYFERFGADHPDWFANGRAEADGQLCYTNPGLRAQIVKDARDFFDGKFEGRVTFSGGNYFSVMPGDNQAWCRCENCRALFDADPPADVFAAPARDYASRYVWSTVADVAREVARTHPEGNIVCCAYADYLLPPAGLELPPNVTVFLCRAHSENPTPETWPARDAWVRSWARLTGNIVFWDYYLFPVGRTGAAFPAFLPHAIEHNIKLMRDLGLDAGFMAQMAESTLRNLAYDHPRIYLTARLLDDWDLDADALLDEYYRLFYGPAEEPMRRFWTRLEDLYVRSSPPSAEYRAEEYDWMVRVVETDMRELAGHLDEAGRRAGADGVYAERVALVRGGVLDWLAAARELVRGQVARTKHANIPQLAAPRALAGDLSDPVWRDAARLDGWRKLDDAEADLATEAYAFRDGLDLYVGFRCAEPDMAGLTAERTRHDDTWLFRDDSVELFVDVGRKRDSKRYFHLLMNSVPALRDSFCRNGIAWESGAEIATARAADGWTLEMKLPLASLGVEAIEPGEVWGMNFCRSRPVRRDAPSAMQNENFTFYSWNAPWGFHETMRYGVVMFE